MIQYKYGFNDIKPPLINMLDVVITAGRNDDRSSYLRREIQGLLNGKMVQLSTDKCHERLSCIIINGTTGEIEADYKEQDFFLIQDLRKILIEELSIQSKNVMIDITGLDQSILCLLIKLILKECPPRSLFAAYTEPETYELIKDDEEICFCEEVLGVGTFPGFAERDSGLKKVLVALLGFEGHRLDVLLEEIQPNLLVPVIGFPSYMPEWKSIAIVANSYAIKGFDSLGEIRTCESTSPFKVYSLLAALAQKHRGEEFLIAPLGTRPHTLGAAIYASLNHHANMIYDFPVEKANRDRGVGRTHVYNLSKFIP